MKANIDRIKANKKVIIYPELSYELMALLFKVHNTMGKNFQEKYYQRAVEIELKKQGIPYEREKLVRLYYEKENIGRYYIDFVVSNKIALEIKAADYFKREFTAQVLAYLSSAQLKLGIIVNFNSQTLLYKRYVNPLIRDN